MAKQLISRVDGLNHELGLLERGKPVTHDAQHRELSATRMKEYARSEHLELVDAPDEAPEPAPAKSESPAPAEPAAKGD